jgi:hypothetical protein
MIRQPKRPAIRLRSGPAGSPLARLNSELARAVDAGNAQPGDGMAELVVEILEAKHRKKRGRPPKNQRAMTGAERVWQSRNRQNLDAAIVRVYKEHSDGKGTGEAMYIGSSANLDAADQSACREGRYNGDSHGVPAKNAGLASDPDERTDPNRFSKETDYTFIKRFNFANDFELSREEKEQIVVARLAHSCALDIPDKMECRCGICWSILPWRRDVIEHVETAHAALVDAEIRETFPHRRKQKSALVCKADHPKVHKRATRRGYSEIYCGRCGLNLSNFATSAESQQAQSNQAITP